MISTLRVSKATGTDVVAGLEADQPLRLVWPDADDPHCAVEVIGLHQAMAMPVRATVTSWFTCHFHHPAVVTVRAGEETVAAETVVVWAPGEVLGHRPLQRMLTRSWLRCRGDAIAGCLAASGLESSRAYPLDAGNDALDHLRLLHRACVHSRPPSVSQRLGLITAWLHTIAHQTGLGEHGDQVAGVAAVRRLLETDWRHRHHLDHLATVAGCSRAQLCRSFRRAVGCSPGAYALALRLDHACELLATTALDIAAIAAACGFADRYHFSRAFSARHDRGPAAFRRGSNDG